MHLLMTALEDDVREAMRGALPKFGVQCDALTGDGLLARPTSEAATPLTEVLRALEAEVLCRTGVAAKLAGKTLDGNAATGWPTRVCSASSACVRSYGPSADIGSGGSVRLCSGRLIEGLAKLRPLYLEHSPGGPQRAYS